VKGKLPAVSFNFDGAPKIERKAELTSKKKEKAEKSAPIPVPAMSEKVEPQQKKEKKEKKPKETVAEGSGKKQKGGAEAAKDAAANEDPAPYMIDLRVGKIVDSKWTSHLNQYIFSHHSF
jgi:aminoacyl tRNA synthase complex-interacting multifunctional protein 1